MKLRYLVMGLVLTLAALEAKSQIFEMYYQGFETTEQVRFTVDPTTAAVYDYDIKMSGDRSLKLVQSVTDEVVLISDTLDFTQNLTLRYISLEFNHISNTYLTSGTTTEGCKIYYKRANQSDSYWTHLTGPSQQPSTDPNYDFSGEFNSQGNFNRNSYGDTWQTLNVTNDLWKTTRLNLDNAMPSSVAPNERKLLIKFVVSPKGTGSTNNAGWWLDNVRVRSSQNQMINPAIDMRIFPDGGLLPSSRGARVTFKASPRCRRASVPTRSTSSTPSAATPPNTASTPPTRPSTACATATKHATPPASPSAATTL